VQKIAGQKNDRLAKSRQKPVFVIPAKAGIQFFKKLDLSWTPAFAGVTTFFELVKNDLHRNIFS